VPELDLVFRAPRVVTADGEVARCVGVRAGRIAAVAPLSAGMTADQVVELGDDVALLPGLVDTHVHVNEPGRTEWEGFATATRAAAAGGVTTILDMPLNSVPPTVDAGALASKRAAAAGKCFVDVGFWGGAVPGNLSAMRGLHDAGVFGFKCFLVPSGVEEFPPLVPDQFEEVLAISRTFGALVIVHAEDAATIAQAPAPHGRAYRAFLRSRPPEAENVAIARVVEAARRTGARVHILHLSSAGALTAIRRARDQGVAVTVETCPHYLFFTADDVPDGATQFTCCPPIREADNRESLWDGLADGTIDAIVSDHSPCPPELKRLDVGDFGVAWGGISSLEVGLPAVWTQARRRGHTLADLARWAAEGPANLAAVHHKGRIAPGYDADVVVFAPDDARVVEPASLHHRHAVTPYQGRTLTGVVRETWLRGVLTDDVEPRGRLLSRAAA
jgi:allantoinase